MPNLRSMELKNLIILPKKIIKELAKSAPDIIKTPFKSNLRKHILFNLNLIIYLIIPNCQQFFASFLQKY